MLHSINAAHYIATWRLPACSGRLNKEQTPPVRHGPYRANSLHQTISGPRNVVEKWYYKKRYDDDLSITSSFSWFVWGGISPAYVWSSQTPHCSFSLLYTQRSTLLARHTTQHTSNQNTGLEILCLRCLANQSQWHGSHNSWRLISDI
jgi:hypothetical protein